MKSNTDITRYKKASFTVEAAVIVPIAALCIVLLIGYIYFMHESVWSNAAAYEAGFYALQRREDEVSVEEMVNERLDQRYNNSILGMAKNNSSINVSNSKIKISWSYGILEEAFGDTFKINDKASLNKIAPVRLKRLEWAANYLMN